MVFADTAIDASSSMDKNNKKDAQGIDNVPGAIVLNQIRRKSQKQKNMKKILYFSKNTGNKSWTGKHHLYQQAFKFGGIETDLPFHVLIYLFNPITSYEKYHWNLYLHWGQVEFTFAQFSRHSLWNTWPHPASTEGPFSFIKQIEHSSLSSLTSANL